MRFVVVRSLPLEVGSPGLNLIAPVKPQEPDGYPARNGKRKNRVGQGKRRLKPARWQWVKLRGVGFPVPFWWLLRLLLVFDVPPAVLARACRRGQCPVLCETLRVYWRNWLLGRSFEHPASGNTVGACHRCKLQWTRGNWALGIRLQALMLPGHTRLLVLPVNATLVRPVFPTDWCTRRVSRQRAAGTWKLYGGEWRGEVSTCKWKALLWLLLCENVSRLYSASCPTKSTVVAF